MLLTYSSAVIGLVTLTVIGTVLPFSTSGGTLSFTFPVRTGASPLRLPIAEASIAGVASAGRTVTIGIVPHSAAPPARPRKRRRVDGSKSCMRDQTLLEPSAPIRSELNALSFVSTRFLHANRYPLRLKTLLVAQRCKIRHDIFDLLRGEDRLAAPIQTHAIQSVDPVIGWHDGCRIEARGVDQPEPKLADGRTAAGAGQARRQIALELGFRERSGVAENAGAGAVKHQCAAAGSVTGSTGQRLRHAVADHRIGCQRLRAGRAGQGEKGGHEPRDMGDCSSQRHPP